MYIATFRLLTASLLQAMRSTEVRGTIYITGKGWLRLVHFDPPIVTASRCSLSGPLLYRSPIIMCLFLSWASMLWWIYNSLIPQVSTVSQHAPETGHSPIWNEVEVYWLRSSLAQTKGQGSYHIRRHPNNINGYNGIGFIVRRRLAVSSRNVVIYASSD